MNSWIASLAGGLLGWLADYYLLATLLLAAAFAALAGSSARASDYGRLDGGGGADRPGGGVCPAVPAQGRAGDDSFRDARGRQVPPANQPGWAGGWRQAVLGQPPSHFVKPGRVRHVSIPYDAPGRSRCQLQPVMAPPAPRSHSATASGANGWITKCITADPIKRSHERDPDVIKHALASCVSPRIRKEARQGRRRGHHHTRQQYPPSIKAKPADRSGADDTHQHRGSNDGQEQVRWASPPTPKGWVRPGSNRH